jgi:hypothetical protein
MLRRMLTVLALVVVLPACLGTPQPDPPNAVGVDPAHLFGYGTDGPPTVLIQGEAGAVYPADAVLRIWSLDREEPVVDVTPAPDGSFAVEVPGEIGGEFRLQALFDGDRSLPVDVVVDGIDRVSLALRPLADCLTISPEWETTVGPGGEATIRLRNDCAGPVVLSRIAIRTPVAAFAVVSPTTLDALPVGAELPIVVEYVYSVGVPDEEILLIEISSPIFDRRPITLLGTP